MFLNCACKFTKAHGILLKISSRAKINEPGQKQSDGKIKACDSCEKRTCTHKLIMWGGGSDVEIKPCDLHVKKFAY